MQFENVSRNDISRWRTSDQLVTSEVAYRGLIGGRLRTKMRARAFSLSVPRIRLANAPLFTEAKPSQPKAVSKPGVEDRDISIRVADL